MCWGITAFLTISASILFFMALQRWESVSAVIAVFFKSLQPITYGLILAYLLNPLLNAIEHYLVAPVTTSLLKNKPVRARGLSRGFSILLAWIIAAVFVFTLFALIVPEIYNSIGSLVEILPAFGARAIGHADKLLKENPEIMEFLENFISGFTTDFAEIMQRVQEWIPNLNVMITSLTGSVYAVITAVLNVLIGVIVSVYVLKDKEKFVAQFKRLFYSTLPFKRANGVISFFRITHDKFGNFITGKIFDSMIIGVLCFALLAIFKIPYSVLVSVIVGVTNVIPFFGPFIGAIPSAILILFASPIKCLTFVIIIICLQQFDGNILGPKILGSTTGLSSFWVMFSILVGSGLFGVWGMVCSVPLCAVVFYFAGEKCHTALRRKGIDYSPETYEKIHHIDEESKTPVWIKNK